jgi:maltose O-acetyltransferase
MPSPGILGVMKIDGLSEKQKMLRGELYNGTDRELVAERQRAESQLALLNGSSDPEERVALLRNLLGAIGEETVVRSSFFCDYGYNIHLGRGVFLNFNCVLLDVMPIRIGDGTQIGPAVQIYAADHPREPKKRLAGLECGKPVTIGRNVWIGGGAILLPGIMVGDDAVIGAGSVVTRDVSPAATVAGNPARLLHN